MAKTRVTVDVPDDLLAWVDSNVDQHIFSSRTHAVLLALKTLKRIQQERPDLMEWVYSTKS